MKLSLVATSPYSTKVVSEAKDMCSMFLAGTAPASADLETVPSNELETRAVSPGVEVWSEGSVCSSSHSFSPQLGSN